MLFVALLIIRKPTNSGHFRVSVVNAYTLAPIADAQVIVAECNAVYKTDDNGRTLIFGVPVFAQNTFSDLCDDAEYGFVTLIAYCDGYYPNALFYAHVYKDRVREGPTLYLFPEGSEIDADFTSFVESPDETLIRTLIDHYRP